MNGYGSRYDNWMGMDTGSGWFGGIVFLLFSLLIFAGVVVLVMWAVRAARGGDGAHGAASPPVGAAGHDDALAIAKRRFASGEIDKEQYEDIRRSLGS